MVSTSESQLLSSLERPLLTCLVEKQAATHGNDDAKKRLDALDKTNPELLNRADHEQHVDTKLVRKRTQAKIRSDEQRERIAASKLAASFAGPDLSSPPPQQQQHQQPMQSQGYNPGRQSVASVSSGGSAATLRRSNTQRQVEAAARMGQQLPLGNNGRATPSIPQNGQMDGRFTPQAPNNRQSYRLSDAPPTNLPVTQRPRPQAGPVQEIKVNTNQPQRAQPSSFAEMVKTSSCLCEVSLVNDADFAFSRRVSLQQKLKKKTAVSCRPFPSSLFLSFFLSRYTHSSALSSLPSIFLPAHP